MEDYNEPYSEQEIIEMILHYYNEFEEKQVNVNVTHGKVVSSKKYLPKQEVITYNVTERIINEDGQSIDHRIPLTDEQIIKILNALLNEKGINVADITYSSTGLTVIGQKVIFEARMI